MKKVIIIAAAALMSSVAMAQVKFGPQVGFTSSSSNVKDFDTKSVSLYQAGFTVQIPLGVGFAIQPALVYQMKGASLDKAVEAGGMEAQLQTLETKVGYLELPVQVQWGPDLGGFRPYAFAEPFVGVGINTDNTAKTLELAQEDKKAFKEAALKRLEYGLGLGVGIEVWKLQLSARYFWNFGSLYDGTATAEETANAVGQTVKAAFDEKKNFNGITVSLAFLF